MSFIKRNELTGVVYAPGYFLFDDENCVRETRTISATDPSVKTTASGGKYVPAGATYKEGSGDGATVVGVVFEDVDVTNGDAPGSVVTKGTIYKNRLVTPADAAALKTAGFSVIEDEPEVTRPDGFDK